MCRKIRQIEDMSKNYEEVKQGELTIKDTNKNNLGLG